MARVAVELKRKGFPVLWVDMGGGLGIPYHSEAVPSWEEYAQTLKASLIPTGLEILTESPGAVSWANAESCYPKWFAGRRPRKRNF